MIDRYWSFGHDYLWAWLLFHTPQKFRCLLCVKSNLHRFSIYNERPSFFFQSV